MLAERLPETTNDEAELLAELADLQLPTVTMTCPLCNGASAISGVECHRCDTTGKIKRWSVQTYDQALSIAERLAAVAAQERERADAFNARIQRLQAERDAALMPLVQRQERLSFLLEEYHRRLFEADKKAKTVPLCDGVVCSCRKSPDGLDYGDEQVLASLLIQRVPALVKPTVRKQDLKARVHFTSDGTAWVPDINGEVLELPTVRQVPGETKFSVKVEV